MAQNWPDILGTNTVKESRALIISRDESLKSSFSGTMFPTTSLVVGMHCYRSDLSREYTLGSLSPTTWVLTADMGSAIVGSGELDALAELPSANDTIPYFTGPGAADLASFTAFARSLVAATTAANARTVLDVVPATSEKAGLVELATITETNGGTDATRAVTPAGLAGRTATPTRAGISRQSTIPEAESGTSTTPDAKPHVTPEGVAAALAVAFQALPMTNTVQKITASGTFTAPRDGWYFAVLTGGGGAGFASAAQASATSYSGGGGGGGETSIGWVWLDEGATVSVTIGAGGAYNATLGSVGGDGGTTSFGTFTAVGGGHAAGELGGLGGSGGVGSLVAGQPGQAGAYLGASDRHFPGGAGGASLMGAGARSASYNSVTATRIPGGTPTNGGGGSGSSAFSSSFDQTNQSGTSGAPGSVMVFFHTPS